VQRRLLACLAGGLAGAAVTFLLNANFGLSPTIALIGGSSIGAALGYVGSLLFDVFTASPEDFNAES
jgi:uncharacterized membrane protein YjjB (DUF3815 family)